MCALMCYGQCLCHQESYPFLKQQASPLSRLFKHSVFLHLPSVSKDHLGFSVLKVCLEKVSLKSYEMLFTSTECTFKLFDLHRAEMQLQIMAAQAHKGNWELSLRLSEPVLLVLCFKEEGTLLFTVAGQAQSDYSDEGIDQSVTM